eukprot:3794522-Prymnesium_polylepis.1
MALSAVRRLMWRCHIDASEVGMLQVVSDSLLDRSKCIKSELVSVLESGGGDVEGVDNCGWGFHGGTAGLAGCVEWAQGESWDG